MARTTPASESSAGRDKRKVGVKPTASANFLYGFYTPLDQSESDSLGHITIATEAANGQAFLFGVNSPRPARVKRTRDSGASSSSFIKSGLALPTGWKRISGTRYRIPTSSGRTKAVYVKYSVNGVEVKYGWNMPSTTYARVGDDRTALGIKDITADDYKDVAWGVNNPKPPKAIKPRHTDGGSIITFVDPSATLPAGWTSGAGFGSDD